MTPGALVSQKELAHCFQVNFQLDEPEEVLPASLASLPQAQPDEAFAQALAQRLDWQYPRQALTKVPAKVSVTSLVHTTREMTLERPAFLYKEGLTAAERGTALHAFLQHADLDAAARDVRAEAQRQVEQKLLLPDLYDKLDFAKLETFFASELYARLQTAQKVHREFEFITALPAQRAAVDKTADYGAAQVLVQGVADLILEFEDFIELVDYKTDRGKTAQQLAQEYRPQLELYAQAIRRRFPKPIRRMTLYSFALGQEIEL